MASVTSPSPVLGWVHVETQELCLCVSFFSVCHFEVGLKTLFHRWNYRCYLGWFLIQERLKDGVCHGAKCGFSGAFSLAIGLESPCLNDNYL